MVSPLIQRRQGRLCPCGDVVRRQYSSAAPVVVCLATTPDDANDDAAYDDVTASTHDDDAAPGHDDVASGTYDVHAARRSNDGTAQPRIHDGSRDASASHELRSPRLPTIIPWNACPLLKRATWWPPESILSSEMMIFSSLLR